MDYGRSCRAVRSGDHSWHAVLHNLSNAGTPTIELTYNCTILNEGTRTALAREAILVSVGTGIVTVNEQA